MKDNNRTTHGGRALVTGVAGFLGSNLLQRLLRENWSVVGIDNLSMGRIENIQGVLSHKDFSFLHRDITDKRAFDTIKGDFDCIVHLAAFKIPRYGKAIDTLKINYTGTENVLELARRFQCKCVLASSSDVYGRNPNIPFNEENTDSVIGSSKSSRWAYSVSKLMDEHLALAYQDAYGFPVTLLRLFGSYGPHQHLSWWGGPQSVFIDAALKDKIIPVHGDGQQTRSFTYVTDTIDGIYECIVRTAANGEIINIGSTEEITILDLARKIWNLSGASGEAKIEFVPYRSFHGNKYQDVMRRVPDTSLCERLLDVRARVKLDAGLVSTIDWQRSVTIERGQPVSLAKGAR